MPPGASASLAALALLLAAIFISSSAAQSNPAAGTYQLASPSSFRNGSAFFAGNAALTVTEGLIDIDENQVDMIIQLRITAGNSEALFTTGAQIGVTGSGKLLLTIFDCQENVLSGGGFGFSLCAVAQQANGCSNTLNWGQGTTNAPFANRTLIVMDGLCGLVGTQLWQCGSAGACNAATGSLAALPTGEFLIYGERPSFVLDNPQGIIPSLVNTTLMVLNNYEHMLIFSFTAGTAIVTVKLSGAAVLDTKGELLFSYSACSQANTGGPVAFQLCSLFDSEDGCETSTLSAQFDIDPPNNITAILLGNTWCSFSGTFNYLCTGTCQAPINNGAAVDLGIVAGNCLSFNGNTINFDATTGGCTIPELDVGVLTVDEIDGQIAVFNQVFALNLFADVADITNLTVTNFNALNSNIQNQTVVNQQIVNQAITNQTVINQQIVNQQVTNQTIVEQTVVQQTVINQNVTNIVIEETGAVYDLTIDRYVFMGISFAPTQPFYAKASQAVNLSFVDINFVPQTACPGSPAPATYTMEKVGKSVTGLLTFSNTGVASDQLLGVTNGCDSTVCAGNNQAFYMTTGPAQIPASMRPSSPVIGHMGPFMMYSTSDGSPEYNPVKSGFCNLQFMVFPDGTLAWMPVRGVPIIGDTDPCVSFDCNYSPSNRQGTVYGFKTGLYYLGAYSAYYTTYYAPVNPNGVNSFAFSYVLP